MKISDVMTKMPHSVGIEQTLEVAKSMLYEYGFRHLPVLQGGKFEGIISDRDIKLAYAVDKQAAGTMLVGDLIAGEAYTVSPDDSLKEVASYMGKTGIGSAIVLEGQKLVGIFTTTDACRVLAQVS